MKFLSTAATLLVCLGPISATARSLDFFNQAPIHSDAKSVEGENPLEYCNDPAGDILQINSVDLTPNPPLPYVLLDPP